MGPIKTQLDLLSSRTQIDLDTLDEEAGKRLSPLADITSNQWETFTELSKSKHHDLIKHSIELAAKHQYRFPTLSKEELIVEICMVNLSLIGSQYVTGSVHIMANPLYAYSMKKIVETGKRFHSISQILDPTFDTSRIVMKVPATWEGLQGCRQLATLGIKTLATTLFTMAQAVLAGEAGCTSISPFVHDLKVHLDGNAEDSDPIFDVVVKAQTYYKAHGISTAVKACAVVNGAEALKLAGVDAFTLPAEIIDELAETRADTTELEKVSLFYRTSSKGKSLEKLSFIDDERKFRDAMALEGHGVRKTDEAITIFCNFQKKAESLVKGSFVPS